MLLRALQTTFIAATCTASLAISQQPVPLQTPASRAQNLEKLDSQTEGISVRASKLIGMNIQNSRKENVGQINDLVFNPVTARIQYVAVTYGGFLGMGDIMFAVPMHAIKVVADPDRKGQVVLVLDVTKEQLDGAQGFDEKSWPDFSDTKFSEEIHRRYGVLEHWNRERTREGSVDVRIDRSGVKLDIDGRKK